MTTSHRTKRNPSICFVRNVHVGVLCVMPADAPTASRLYVAIVERGCAPIVGTAMICADAMVIVRVAVLRLIAVPMDGLVASVTSGCVLGAVGATIRARNAAPERNPIMTMSNLSPSIYIMTSFASSAAAGPSTALPKVLTEYLVKGESYDTYQIPVGTKLFKSYRDTLAKWSIDKVIPVKSPAYFGFDEPNVSENYGFAFAYKTTQPYELLAIDSKKTLAYLWGLAQGNTQVQRALTVGFGYDPTDPDKLQIRTSNEDLDYVLVGFLCEKGLQGYAGDYIRTDGGGQFHPECVMCGHDIHVELNPEYNVDGKLGLASPVEKHTKIHSMLTDKTISKLGPNKRKKEDKQREEEHIPTNLFSDSDGGSRRKKRTHKRVIRRRRSKKNKSRK